VSSYPKDATLQQQLAPSKNAPMSFLHFLDFVQTLQGESVTYGATICNLNLVRHPLYDGMPLSPSPPCKDNPVQTLQDGSRTEQPLPFIIIIRHLVCVCVCVCVCGVQIFLPRPSTRRGTRARRKKPPRPCLTKHTRATYIRHAHLHFSPPLQVGSMCDVGTQVMFNPGTEELLEGEDAVRLGLSPPLLVQGLPGIGLDVQHMLHNRRVPHRAPSAGEVPSFFVPSVSEPSH